MNIKMANRSRNIFISIILCSVVFYTVFAVPVYAYIDPSVATYLIQAVAGIVIAVGAVAGIYIKKAKRKVYDKLNINENKGKEVETDDILINRENGQ